VANSLSSPLRLAGSTMRGINGRGGKPRRSRNLPDVERGRLSQLASRMTVLWVATVLEHFPRLGLQFRQGRLALAHGQLLSEHVDKIEQGQQGSSRAEAVFCHFSSPVGREVREEDHLGCTGAGVREVRFAWAWRLAAAIAKLNASAGRCCPSSLGIG
jgi:hypothetical protein